MEQKTRQWDILERQCKNCTKCSLHETRKNVVMERGSRDANIMLIGEGPGAEEDRLGRAFVGRAGQLLELVFNGLGITNDDIYITNILKCRPPGNANPTKEQAEMCMGYLESQIDLIRPKSIVLLGSVALKHLINSDTGITRSRGKWIQYKGIPVMPTFHPAALLRDDNKKIFMWKDIRKAWEMTSSD